MNINDILKSVSYIEKNFDQNFDVKKLCIDSKKCCKNSLFFAVKGSLNDGNNYIEKALKNGAIVVITSQKPKVNCNYILCEDVNLTKSQICYNFYNLKNSPKLIGVVGTNGKTSITYLLKNIFEYAKKKVGVIGTLGVLYDNKSYDYNMTTPDAITISEILRDMQKAKVEYCFIEVSAHAILQKRVESLYFETLIFTNCTHDHLDYFKTFSDYKNVKKSIFSKKYCKNAVINTDDDLGFEIIKENKSNNFIYGLESPSDVFAVKIEQEINNLSFTVNLFDYIDFISVKMVGLFNVYNILASLTASVLNGISHKDAIKSLYYFNGVDGRNEFIDNYNGASIFVDYAHTPDGLENTLKSFKKICKNNLIVVFGCGGNRDTKKRKIMGEIAGKIADFTIITSDNPRNEDPLKIISEIESGVKKHTKNYKCIENRLKATKFGVKMLQKGDILCVLGKGAEKVQEIKGEKLRYNDKQSIKKIISGGENS